MLCLKELNNLKLLIVEDEKNLAELLKSAIGEYFSKCEVSYDGEDGLKKYNTLKPDIIISDIMIPKLSGLEMSKKIKEINHEQNIIILSAYSDTKKLLSAIDVGVIKYFIKPFDPEELLEYICQVAPKILSKKELTLKDGYIFKFSEDKLFKDTALIKLTKNETTFLKTLIQKEFISKSEIKQLLWNSEDVSDERVRTFIRRFRDKTKKDFIQNISSQGYYLVK